MTNKDVVERVKNAACVHLQLVNRQLLPSRLYFGQTGLRTFFDTFFEDFADIQDLERLLSRSDLPKLDEDELVSCLSEIVKEISTSKCKSAHESIRKLENSYSKQKRTFRESLEKRTPLDEAKANTAAFWTLFLYEWRPHFLQALAKSILQMESELGSNEASPSAPQGPQPTGNWRKRETHTHKQAAAILGVTRKTIYNYIADGDLWTAKNNRIPTDSIEKFLSNKQSS